MSEESDPRLYYPHVARNREPILRVLKRVLPRRGLILELASGSGEHVTYFAHMLPTLLWQPTDLDPRPLASIAAHRTAADAPNLLSPLRLDAMSEQWPVQHADALVCINMIHITPWEACKGLMTGAEQHPPVGRRSLPLRSLPDRRSSYRPEQRRLRCVAANAKRSVGRTRPRRGHGFGAASRFFPERLSGHFRPDYRVF
jgi:hypothetical protein